MKRRLLVACTTLWLMMAASVGLLADGSQWQDANGAGDGPVLNDFSYSAGNGDAFSYIEDGFVSGLQQDAPHGVRTIADVGPYDGWDVLLTDQGWDVRYLASDSWITLDLARDATIAIVWQASEPVPAWLDEWNYVGDPVVIADPQSPKPRRVYEREFSAGEVQLGSVYSEGESGDQRSPYIVLLSGAGEIALLPDDDASDDEANQDEGHGGISHNDHGHDSGAPADGSFVDDVDEWLYGTHHWEVEPLSVVATDVLDQPVEGEACPDWLNFAHTTQAPDGDYYLTWRPIVDPSYGCHFTHEHGSNPERVPGAQPPAYGYGTPFHMRESNYGFKTKALHTPEGIQILATTHFGTAEPHIAVCQRFHWTHFQFVDNGEIVADLTFMGDFGAALKNDTEEPLDHDCEDQRTGELKSQAEIMQETYGARLNPVCTGEDCGPFYYPWRMDNRGLGDFLGFKTHAFTVNTPPVVAACEDTTCKESRHLGGTGAWAFVSFNDGFGVVDEGLNGEFYTDPFGLELRDLSDPDAVRQYIEPGTNIALDSGDDGVSYFPDSRHGGTHGDYTHTLLANGDPNIEGNVPSVVDPQGYIQDKN